MILLSPIEQFQIIGFTNLTLLNFLIDLTINNFLIINILIFELFFIQIKWLNSTKFSPYWDWVAYFYNFIKNKDGRLKFSKKYLTQKKYEEKKTWFGGWFFFRWLRKFPILGPYILWKKWLNRIRAKGSRLMFFKKWLRSWNLTINGWRRAIRWIRYRWFNIVSTRDIKKVLVVNWRRSKKLKWPEELKFTKCDKDLLLVMQSVSIVCILLNRNKKIGKFKNCYDDYSLSYFCSWPWQKLLENILEVPLKIIKDLIPLKKNKNNFVEIIILIYIFILLNNLVGLIPYSFTATSHLIVAFSISFSVFIGVNIITYWKYKMKLFELFIPAGTSLYLALILVPLEFISYFIKPISLGARLFINIMAGHTLLKVILHFVWNLVLLDKLFLSILPFFVLFLLFGLELGVAIIQTYVFTTLCCIYIQDCNP